MFAARLRLPADMSLEAKEARVEQVTMDLGLSQARDTVIGELNLTSGANPRPSAVCSNPSLVHKMSAT